MAIRTALSGRQRRGFHVIAPPRRSRASAHRWPADSPPPFEVDAQPAPDIAWVAWVGAAVDPQSAPARPCYLRATDAKPSKDVPLTTAQPIAS